MAYRVLIDGVVVVHLGFIVFVALGGLLAWRWPRIVWIHVPSLVWCIATLTVGLACPLTALEKGLRRHAGVEGYSGGFVDRYIENVVYPERYTAVLRALAALLIIGGYAGAHLRRAGRSTPATPFPQEASWRASTVPPTTSSTTS